MGMGMGSTQRGYGGAGLLLFQCMHLSLRGGMY